MPEKSLTQETGETIGKSLGTVVQGTVVQVAAKFFFGLLWILQDP